MVSINDGNGVREIEEAKSTKLNAHVPLHISTSRRAFVNNEQPEKNLWDKGRALYSSLQLLKFRSAAAKSLASPSAQFWRIAEGRDEVSRALVGSSSHGFRDRMKGVLSHKIDWVSLGKVCKEWIRDPMNMALLVWMVGVAVSGAILFLVLTGMLNQALPKKSQRDTWYEVNNQIINALFTLMCLYQHPKRIYHLVLLFRWQPRDISKLRKIYCKNGTYKPHEWAHMMVVILLLNLNCFAQYALCGLNWGYKRSKRPAVGVGICLAFSMGAPAIAGVYSIMSPLGKEYHTETDEEAQKQMINPAEKSPRPRTLEKKFSFVSRDEQRFVEAPQWSGGIFDIWEDISIAYLSLFCSFCVFGWNMERLGFGNMYVHIATFLLFCLAPFWIFSLAAVNIDNETVRTALSFTGIVLCLFGLLYGGFWRIQMRKRFNLPASRFQPAATDCALWLCCCFCSLAQEVRTGNSYVIVDNKFHEKRTEGNKHDNGSSQAEKSDNSASPVRATAENGNPDCSQLAVVVEASSTGESSVAKNETMTPPVQFPIERDTS